MTIVFLLLVVAVAVAVLFLEDMLRDIPVASDVVSPLSKQSETMGYLGLIGCAVVAIGALLPFWKVNAYITSFSGNYLSIRSTIPLVLAIGALGLAVYAFIIRKEMVGVVVGGGFVLNLILKAFVIGADKITLMGISVTGSDAREAWKEGLGNGLSISIGFYIMVIGAVLMILSAFLGSVNKSIDGAINGKKPQ